MSDSREHETPENETRDAGVSERQREFTRRALIRAGWVAPLVTTVNIPSAAAQTPSPHNDAIQGTRTTSLFDVEHAGAAPLMASQNVWKASQPNRARLRLATCLTCSARMTQPPV